MLIFLKAQAAAMIGSAADFLMYAVLVQLTGSTPVLLSAATAEGAVTGGIVNFLVARKWVFNQGQSLARVQAMRYVLVWTGSIFLNSAGMYLVSYFTTLHYAIARILVSVLVGVTYNYFLQKRFVFK